MKTLRHGRPFGGFLFLALLLLADVPAQAGWFKPKWVKSRPQDTEYFIGIGHTDKKGRSDYEQHAKTQALHELVSLISLTLTSQFVDKARERSGLEETDIRSEIEVRARGSLTGHELVDVWENNREYWAYYRFSKAEFARQRALARQQATAVSYGKLMLAEKHDRSGNPSAALRLYVQALSAVGEFLGDELVVAEDGKEIPYANRMLLAIQLALQKAKFTGPQSTPEYFPGSRVNAGLSVSLLYSHEGKALPLAGLPLACSLVKGKAEIMPEAILDIKGSGDCRILSISKDSGPMIVRAEIDFKKMAELEDVSALVEGTLMKLGPPRIELPIRVLRMPVFVEVEETNLGADSREMFLRGTVVETLTKAGLDVVKDLAQARMLVQVRGNSRKGADFHAMFTAFAEVEITVKDLRTESQVFQRDIRNVSGMAPTYEDAGKTALRKAASQLEEGILSDLAARLVE